MGPSRIAFDFERRNLTLAKGTLGPATMLARSADKHLIEHRQLLLGSFEIHRHNVILPTVKASRVCVG